MGVTYEEWLGQDLDRAWLEASMHFEEQSAVHRTMRAIARRLDELGVPYAVVGGMAMFAHGYRRFTEDVDILVTAEGLEEIHRQLEGRGYLPPFAGSKQLRDTDTGVRIEFLVSGCYPGDGRPKPVAFPDPAAVAEDRGGIRVVRLATLVELKLASGMTVPARRRDLADVQDVIKALNLPAEFADQLDPFVREQYRQLWDEVQRPDPHEQ
jgi:hypothetical protein